nr:AraC family transcriptional regulator [Pseudoalteromonas sp. XMcav2-N]
MYELVLVSSATTSLLFVFISLSLPFKQRNSTHYLLGYFALIGMVQLVDMATGPGDTLHQFIVPLALMLGPLFYLYVTAQIPHRQARPIQLALMFMPAGLLLLHVLLVEGEVIMAPLISRTDAYRLIAPVELGFVIVASLQLRRATVKLSRVSNEPQPALLVWLHRLCWLNMTILLVEVTYYIALATTHLQVTHHRAFLNAALQLFLLLVAWCVIRSPRVFYTERQKQAVADKYQKSGLTPELSNYYARKLDKLIRDEQPYLSNELTLSALARQVGLNTHNLSQLLNEHLGTSYHDYINRFRVTHATQLLEETTQSVEEIAYQSGFGTRAAFYAAFKKFRQTTPAKWRVGVNQHLDSQRHNRSMGPDE